MAVKIYFPSFLYGATGAQNISSQLSMGRSGGDTQLIDRGQNILPQNLDFYPNFIQTRNHLGDRFGKMMIPNPNFFRYIYILSPNTRSYFGRSRLSYGRTALFFFVQAAAVYQ